MEIKQLESAIEKKAQQRAEDRARTFITAINAAWNQFFGHAFRTASSRSFDDKEIEHLKKVFIAIARTDGSRYFQTGYFLADVVVEAEKTKVVDEILKATEAVRELADMRGEE